MSNAAPQIDQRNITRLTLTGEGAWPDLCVENLSPQLNLFYGQPRTGKSSVAQLVGHLMYGVSESPWRRQFGQTVSTAEGSVHLGQSLDDSQGNFVLRRHYNTKGLNTNTKGIDRRDENRQCRLTISSGRGDKVDGQTIQHLLSGLSPQLAAKVFFVDFAESPRADWLLNETFAREFTSSQPAKTPQYDQSYDRQYSCCVPATNSSRVDRVDRRRIDELVKRRDTIASQIEQLLSRRRSESDVLEGEIRDADSALASKRQRAEHLKMQLHGIDTQIAELETQLRYFSLEHNTKHFGQPLDVERQQRELAELDEEITRCRQSIASSQQRESLLRTELAQCSPDGTADSVTCLADGRATLGTLEQLLDDLDAEVSQLARAHEPGRCIGHDSHAKLSPVAALLRQQVYALCGQFTEQERIVRRQQLTAESRQLTRVLIELGDRLDLLLSRRESLIQSSQLASQPARLIPQPPATEHCRCEHHGTFVQSADAMVLGRADRGRVESEARSQLGTVQRQRTQLVEEFNALQREIEQIAGRWEKLQRERAGLIGGASIEDQQAELERLESVIRQSLQTAALQTTALQTTDAPASSSVGIWRASDILAQLTNGHLVQVRLERQHAQATIVDRHGQPRPLESLSAGEHDQLYLALTLALVSSYAQRGVRLPLILDEPFLQQNPAQTAAMVGVLDEFARAGHQLLVFTEDRDAQRRFSTLSAKLFDLEALRQAKPTPAVTTTFAPAASPTIQTTSTRIIRETYDGHSTPVLRLAPVNGVGDGAGDGEPQQDDLFYLTENSSFSDFPVLGADTPTLFRRINIHSIGDLLATDATQIAQQLDRESITVDTVRLWQSHMALMCHVPILALDDAQVLAASGIDSPEDLFDADIDVLLRSIENFLRTDRGRRFDRTRGHYSRSRLSGWRTGARHYRDRWQRSSRRYSGWQSHRSRRHSESTQQTESSQRNGQGQRTERKRTERKERSSSRKQRNTNRPRRFYLAREQDVEDAPSIGPKTATRLAKTGIRTVADLLSADPDSTADELDVSHIKAETIAAWQHQARLVCQIPELRGYGAQLLVACGMTQPEQIARQDADALVSQVLSFCETKEGQRILRSGDAPEREKIAEWAELASHSRSLDAA